MHSQSRMTATILKAVVCLFLAQQCFAFVALPREETPDEDKTPEETILKHGYPAETHHVLTEDGYILEVHRIPFSPKSPEKEGRPVVLMHHGLLSSSFDWIVQGPGSSLAYLFADIGYDVWLGNGRGNMYARNHTTLNPDKMEFWEFSWHEIGVHDLPAEIDYILELTGQEKVSYVGHSMGTTAALVLLSERPEYNDKMREVALLAPVATLTHSTSAVRLLVPFLDELGILATLVGHGEFLPGRRLIAEREDLCRDNAPFQEVCANFLFLFLGWDSQELNRTVLPVMLGHTPAGASARDVIHYGQVISAKRFQKYDYGPVRNLATYGHIIPPAYDLSKITSPVSLHHSDNDNLADPKDVQWLAEHLPNLVGSYRVPLAAFNHLDFIWAIDVDNLVNNRVVSVMSQFE